MRLAHPGSALMPFRLLGLSPDPFLPLFGLSETELAGRCARRIRVDASPGYPDRIELREARPGETVLLVNYTHLSVASPYRASHAVYVREGAEAAYDRTGEVPESLRLRTLSVRAFDSEGMMVGADLVEGGALEALIERFHADPRVAVLHAHYAKAGCFAARIERA
jgi:hypothetical protein